MYQMSGVAPLNAPDQDTVMNILDKSALALAMDDDDCESHVDFASLTTVYSLVLDSLQHHIVAGLRPVCSNENN